MCGRYASSANPNELVDEFDVDIITGDLPEPDFNVAPTVSVPSILERVDKQTTEVRRRLSPLTWGLVPSWAKDRSIGSRLINARFETVSEKPAFRKAFSLRRCLLPADGYYEWYDLEQPGGGKAKKQPFFIHRGDGGRLVMAGLYEIWRDPKKSPDDDDAWLRTCVVITTTATDSLGHIHERMPMVITKDSYDAWLDPKLTDADAARRLLAVTGADALEAYAVSTAVNSVKNNGSSLIEPLAEEAAPGGLF